MWHVGTIVEAGLATPRIRRLTLAVPDWPGHRPGQHVDVRLTAEDGYQAVRSYSLASPPEAPDLELAVERLEDGEVSPYLVDEAQVGDRLELSDPIGGSFVWEAGRGGPLLLVAGGSGIAPLMAMLRHRAAVGSDVRARLLYSARSLEDVAYRDELDRQTAVGRLTACYCLTRRQPPDWTGYSRRVDLEILREVAWPPADGALAFVCGPTRFVEVVADGLVSLGYPPERVKTERFGATGG